ncbi:hypothetical protein FOB72_18070 (plasmid) [Cupriavidus pauculus]|uniref:Chromosome partition protein Smc n=1 Tax=Cupriavidus pauculus TaxID=82633 RepID=A0A5P2H8M3_9BURK|nr:hypothetical protein [Cupriavidus pauculus]QET04058.1 hypothetical protein FOB72_18070 [Cupriavidus pauculus]
MPEKKKKLDGLSVPPAESAKKADIVDFPVSRLQASMDARLREIMGPSLSEDQLGRLGDAIHNIRRVREKIERALLEMGSELQNIHDLSMESVIGEFGDTRGARMRGWTKFNQLAKELLELQPNQAKLYLGLYVRFQNHNGALSKLNTGELMILQPAEYTDEEVDAVIEFKDTDPTYRRGKIRDFIKQLRRKHEQVIDVSTRLDIATSELANTVQDNADKDLEIRRLNEEVSRLAAERDADRDALSHVREELTRHNHSQSMQQMRIQDLERETRELQERVASARANARTETVEVPIVPPGYATIEEALAAKNSELEAARSQLADIENRRLGIEQEIKDRASVLDRRAKADGALATLVDQFEKTVSAFAATQLAVQMDGSVDQFQSTLTVLDSIVGRLHADIRAALQTR